MTFEEANDIISRRYGYCISCRPTDKETSTKVRILFVALGMHFLCAWRGTGIVRGRTWKGRI